MFTHEESDIKEAELYFHYERAEPFTKKKKCLVVRYLPNIISAFADCLFYLIAMNSPPNTLVGTPC